MTKQEELYRLESLNGARPKWTRPGRPLPVIEEPRGSRSYRGYERSGDEWGGMRAPAPKLPPLRQDRPSAGVVTPPRRDADRHGAGDSITKYGMAPKRTGCYARGGQEALPKLPAGRLLILWQVD